MPTVASKKSKSGLNVVVNKNMKDYTNEPYFVEKAEKARQLIKKHGLPKSHSNRNK